MGAVHSKALVDAIERGDVETVARLLSEGDVKRQPVFGFPLLHIAAANGHVEVVQKLLEFGADVDITDHQNICTPLLPAAQDGHVEVVQQLLKAGADVNKASKVGATPILLAAQNGHVEVVQLLLEAGADVDKANETGNTPLYQAAIFGHVEVVQQLLKAGAEVDKAASGGLTAVYGAAHQGHVEVVQQLLRAGADVDKSLQGAVPEWNYQNITALHGASTMGHFEVACLLILSSKGAVNRKAMVNIFKLPEDLEYKDVTPLHIASAFGYVNIVSLLVSAGADTTCTGISKRGKRGQVKVQNSYAVAVEKGHNLVAYMLWSNNKIKTAGKEAGREFPVELLAHRATIEARQQTEKTIIRTIITTVMSEHVGRRWRELGRRLNITDVELDDIERRCNINLRGLKEMTVESLLMWLDRQPYWPNIFDVWWALQVMQMADVADLLTKTLIDERNLAGLKDDSKLKANDSDDVWRALWNMHLADVAGFVPVTASGERNIADAKTECEENNDEKKEQAGSEAPSSSERRKELSVSTKDSVVVPIEVEMGGPELRALYNRACEEGYTEVYITRFVLVGKFGNGKTNLCNSLVGDEFDPEWKITDGIDIHPCVMTQEHQWRKLEEGTKKTRTKKKRRKRQRQKTKGSQSQSEVGVSDTTGAAMYNRVEQATDSPPSVPTRPQVAVSEPQEAYLKATKIFQKKDIDDKSNVTGTKEYPMISIWDFGGQEIFYSTQQVFYTHRAIYGMTLDLTKPIDSSVGEMSTNGGPTSHCNKEKDFIDYHLESIRAHTRPIVPHHEDGQTPAARDIQPPVMFLFTHKDQVSEEMKQAFHSDTKKHLKGKVIDKHVIDRYFSVDNTKRNPEDPELSELRAFILNLARQQSYMGERIPVKWLELKSKLQDMHKQGKRYCSLQEVMEAVGSPSVTTTPEENAISILTFWHLCGDIIFFPVQTLRDFVILEPQWFVDVCKTIITIPQYRDREVKEEWDRLQETGVLQDHLIEYVWRHREEALRYNLMDHKQELLDMMEKFDLVLQCHGRSEEESGSKCDVPGEATYFVPSLLTAVTDEKKLYPPGTACSKPIFIVFDGKFCPVGLYHRMVISSMRRYFSVKPQRAYATCAKFITNNLKRQTFLLTKEKFFLKVELVSSVQDETSYFSHGPSVREGLEKDLREIIDKWAPGIRYKWCLRCSCKGHRGEADADRFLPIEELTATEYFKSGEIVCETYVPATTTVKEVGLSDWFQNPLPHAGDETLAAHPVGLSSVSQDDFHLVVREVCPRWRKLAFRLNLSSANVDEIEERHRGDPRRCCRAACDRWVQLNGSSATVEVLKDALISIREVPTAEHIDDLQQAAAYSQQSTQLHTSQGRSGSAESCFPIVVENVCPRWTELSRHLGLTATQVDEITGRHHGDPRDCCREALELWSLINGGNASKERLIAALTSAEEIVTVEKLDAMIQ
ncbi:ANKRD17 [Branchiostoma lanceolatum]|uniref:ANKRD17 protein n=1 Tax=Branchiostoma lanceolatum TaxID=7740 RepID=A0A8K0A4V4_BRALA|nr:ANKRD17 [Branchiostoma lanceolatum]